MTAQSERTSLEAHVDICAMRYETVQAALLETQLHIRSIEERQKRVVLFLLTGLAFLAGNLGLSLFEVMKIKGFL